MKFGFVRMETLAPDVVLARFSLRARTNTNLWALGILLGFWGLIPALIIQACTWKTLDVPVERVLVRNGTEWRMFGGEWMGDDEVDRGWLEGETTGPRT